MRSFFLERRYEPPRTEQPRPSALQAADVYERPRANRDRIAAAARRMVDGTEGAQWGAQPGDRPPIRNPNIEGGGPDGKGGYRSPAYLDGRYKCSVFSGEALYRAGFQPPYSSYGDQPGKRHYEGAARWHEHTRPMNGQPAVFESLKSHKDLRAGDAVTFQNYDAKTGRWSKRDNAGHAAIITRTRKDGASIAEVTADRARRYDLEQRIYDKMGLQPGDRKGLQAALSRMTPGQDRFGTYYELPGKIRVRFLRPSTPL